MDVIIGLQVVSGLVSAAILFLLAAGLSLIFGVCRVLNLAHGSIFMLASFLAYSLTTLFADTPVNFWLALLLIPPLMAALGSLVEIALFRRIYGVELLLQLLPTFALIFIVSDAIRFFWGLTPKSVGIPTGFEAAVSLLGVTFPGYYGVIVLAGSLVALGLWALVYRTRWGLLVRATALDREMSAALGVNEARLYTTVFSLAVWLASTAGVLYAPISGAILGSDSEAMVDAFVVVVVGGLGSIPGSMLAALLIGLVKAFGILVIPQFAMAFVFGLMVIVLVLRPEGLLGRKEQ